MSYWHIIKAVRTLHHGGVICYPTESVYGLGCDPKDLEAVLYLLALKKRQVNKGLLLVAQNVQQLEPYIDINDTLVARKLSEPGDKPISWIVPCKQSTPLWLTGEHQSIVVRISSHSIIQQLCQQFNGAIVSTSANVTGHTSNKQNWMVRKQFGNKIDYYVPGDLGRFKMESEIRNIKTDEIVRASNI